MINPYDGVNLQTAERIHSVSHQHLSHTQSEATPSPSQVSFNQLYTSGARHFAISRYRPSINTYPFDYETNKFVYVANTFGSTLPLADLKRTYGREITFEDDVIGSPSAEHVYPYLLWENKWNRRSNVHINGIGSYYESGLVPNTESGYESVGVNLPYSQVLRNIFVNLQFVDGGGAIINHPNWTDIHKHINFNVVRFICDCLDFDSRVLGTDMIEYIRSSEHVQDAIVPNTQKIDAILSTGRRCWIFCEGDWGTTYGRNELLIPSGVTFKAEREHECLKAYRNGSFFSRYRNTNLSITGVSFADGVFFVSASNADVIQIITDGVTTSYTGTSASQQIDPSAKYVRAVAYTNPIEGQTVSGDMYNDIVFTNPIMINPIEYPYRPAYDMVSQKGTKRFDIMLWG